MDLFKTYFKNDQIFQRAKGRRAHDGVGLGYVRQHGREQVVPAKAAKAPVATAPVATAQETKVNPVAEVTDYPTVLKRTVVDLTDAPSRTQSVSAPFKSDDVDLP